MKESPVTAIIVGAGHRAIGYARLALGRPDLLKIVGVADPNPHRREAVADAFDFDDDCCFESAQELAKVPKFADAVINGTMDHQHVDTAIPLLEAGYDMLLEKPFAVNEGEMRRLVESVRENKRKVMICHVLRYAPFYFNIKERVAAGEIGEILNIQTCEHVSYHHMSTSHVRGKWSRKDHCKTSMLLAKCCHDLDIMMWLMSDTLPKAVSSYGSLKYFKPENAPAEAGERCLVDCPLVDDCIYSAKKLYIYQPNRWAFYVWDRLEHLDKVTLEDKIQSLKTDNPYGRCIYKCGNNVVDHQSVLVKFANGATGTHNMVGGASAALRRIHIIGTKGEIYGNFEDEIFYLSKIDPTSEHERLVEEINLKTGGDMSGAFGGHGGGDLRLAEDFISFVRGEEVTHACTSIFDSVAGHLCVYLADKSMDEDGLPQNVSV